MFRLRFFSVLQGILAATLAASAAEAQTVSPSGQPYPIRLAPDLTEDACGNVPPQASCVSTRPANFTPMGISYADCASGQVLQFSVTLSGFDGNETLQVFASGTSDCTSPTDRGVQGATAAVCWKVAGDVANIVASTPQTFTFDVPVTTLVGWQQQPPFPVSEAPQLLPPSTACSAQPSFDAVTLNVNFVPVDSGGEYAGTAYQYPIATDLVGPPAPGGVDVEAGQGGLVPNWTPNSDDDTAGYDVFLAPPPGQAAQGAGCPAIPGAGDGGLPGRGGIADVAASYLVAGSDGMTATGKSTGAYAITGLTDGTPYAVAVSAVDAFDNVGPTSPPACATPAADGGVIDASIDDTGGGDAGANDGVTYEKAGCLCSQGAGAPRIDALAAVGGAPGAPFLLALVAVILRRRRPRT